MRPLVATDLDGTLVYSRRTRGPGAPAGLRVVEARDGVASAWITDRAARLLAELARETTWVPATTRAVAQFRRLRLPGTRWAVCANGGVLLDHDVPDPAWAARVAALVAEAGAVEALAVGVASRAEGVIGPLRAVDGLFLTATLTSPPTAAWSADLTAHCASQGWIAHVQPTKLHVLPRGLTKGAAIEEVRRRCGGPPLLAAGDALLDADLLSIADTAIRPAHGELHALGWDTEHLAVTPRAGVSAGEDIVAWLLARASSWAGGGARPGEPHDSRGVGDTGYALP